MLDEMVRGASCRDRAWFTLRVSKPPSRIDWYTITSFVTGFRCRRG